MLQAFFLQEGSNSTVAHLTQMACRPLWTETDFTEESPCRNVHGAVVFCLHFKWRRADCSGMASLVQEPFCRSALKILLICVCIYTWDVLFSHSFKKRSPLQMINLAVASVVCLTTCHVQCFCSTCDFKPNPSTVMEMSGKLLGLD